MNASRVQRARPHGPTPSRTLGLAVPVLVALAAILPYAGSVFFEFTFDDVGLILENPYVSADAPWTAPLTHSYWPDRPGTGLYRPLTALTFKVQTELTGTDPRPFHLLNVLLHVGVTLLGLAVLRHLAPHRPWIAASGALLFAVHPLHTEAVTNVVGRAELLAAGFALAGYLIWLRARNARGSIAAGVCFALGAASKESAVGWLLLLALHRLFALPPFAAAGDGSARDARTYGALSRQGRLRGALLADGWVLLCVGSYFLARRLVLGSFFGLTEVSFVDNPLYAAPLLPRFLTAFSILWRAIALHLWPFPLQPDYSYASIPLESSPLSFAGLLALLWVASVALALHLRYRAPLLAWSWLFYAALTLSAANLLLPIGTIMAERLLYLPSLGVLSALVCGAAAALARPRWRFVAPAALAVVLLLMGLRTWERNRDWRSNAALFGRAVVTQPRSVRVRVNMGSVLVEQGRMQAAEREYREALSIHPRHASALNGLGHALLMQGRREEAQECFRQALAITPNNRESMVRLGNLLLEMGRPTDALPLFDRAITLAPDRSDVWIGRASTLFMLERYRASLEAWETAQQRAGSGQDLRRHVAAAAMRAGEREQAISLLQRLVAAEPRDAALRSDLARALLESGTDGEGLDHARTAAEMDPCLAHLELYMEYLFRRGDCEAARGVFSSRLTEPLTAEQRQVLADAIAHRCSP
ncbi:MAG: tetratricopeptide repeat protein [Candidatus Eisenbacteria bacterium]